jgi:hypothetical protein
MGSDSGQLVWGERLPFDITETQLLACDGRQLRALVGMSAAVAWRDGSVAVVNSPSGPATVYEASASGNTVVSTHATLSALLAGIPLSIDRDGILQFVAMDFVGGDRTLLVGVRAVPPATRLFLTQDGVQREEYWPAKERWALIPEADAYSAAERALLRSTTARLEDGGVALALTAGLDSTVAASALAEIGAGPDAFTWGHPDWPDSRGAAATAARFGWPHRVSGYKSREPAVALSALDRDARWSDGVCALALTERQWPRDADRTVVGMGGETGRAFYYNMWSALFDPDPTIERIAQHLGAGRLYAGDDRAREALRDAHREWVAAARVTGVTRWRVLDVLYAEQRVRHWGRSQLPLSDSDIVPLFTPQPLAQALVSLPLEERLTSGFHRRFMRKRGFEPGPDPELPRYSSLGWVLRRRKHQLAGRRHPAAIDDPVDALLAHVWSSQNDLVDWLKSTLVPNPLLAAALGAEWAPTTFDAFRAGRARSAERLMRAAGVVAFEAALSQIGSDGAGDFSM